jgi:hypothetical protein
MGKLPRASARGKNRNGYRVSTQDGTSWVKTQMKFFKCIHELSQGDGVAETRGYDYRLICFPSKRQTGLDKRQRDDEFLIFHTVCDGGNGA